MDKTKAIDIEKTIFFLQGSEWKKIHISGKKLYTVFMRKILYEQIFS